MEAVETPCGARQTPLCRIWVAPSSALLADNELRTKCGITHVVNLSRPPEGSHWLLLSCGVLNVWLDQNPPPVDGHITLDPPPVDGDITLDRDLVHLSIEQQRSTRKGSSASAQSTTAGRTLSDISTDASTRTGGSMSPHADVRPTQIETPEDAMVRRFGEIEEWINWVLQVNGRNAVLIQCSDGVKLSAPLVIYLMMSGCRMSFSVAATIMRMFQPCLGVRPACAAALQRTCKASDCDWFLRDMSDPTLAPHRDNIAWLREAATRYPAPSPPFPSRRPPIPPPIILPP